MTSLRDAARRSRPLTVVIAASLVVAACASAGESGDPSPAEGSAATTPADGAPAAPDGTPSESSTTTSLVITRPDVPNDPTNVVVVMTDDQTVEQMRWLPTVSEYMSGGVEFSNSLVNYPLCGPSRATFLTGQHATNHGLDCNRGLAARFHEVESNSLGPWVQASGVHTIHVGKYLNGYGGRDETRYVPVGWNDWRALAGDTSYKYRQFNMVVNGELIEYGTEDAPAYSTDLLSNHLDEAIRSSPEDQPFFAVFTPLAPHFEGNKPFAVPAARHDGLVTDTLRPANFDSCVTRSACPPEGSALNAPRLTDEQIDVIDEGYRTASETLFAVDEAFSRLLATLTELSELDNTLIVFTSDNGFFYGEHGVTKGKIHPGNEALFVPLYLRGPGFESGTVETAPVSNIDLAPTIVDVFGADAGLEMDGQSLLDPLDPDRALLVQAAKSLAGGYFGVVADGWLFYDWQDLERNELYAPSDRLQVTSLDQDPSFDPIEASLAVLTAELRACAGAACAISWRADDVDTSVTTTTPEPVSTDPVTVEANGPAPAVTATPNVGGIDLVWEPVDNAEAYRYRLTPDGGEAQPWVRVDLATEAKIGGLVPGATFTVEVSIRRGDRWRRSAELVITTLSS